MCVHVLLAPPSVQTHTLFLSQTRPHTHTPTLLWEIVQQLWLHTSSTTRQQHMKGERWWDRDVQVFKHPHISVLLTKATQTIALFFLSLPHKSNTHTHTHTHTYTQDVEGGEILQSTNGNGIANVFICSVAMEQKPKFNSKNKDSLSLSAPNDNKG